MKIRRRTLVWLAAGMVVVGTAIGAYLSGAWVPNLPAKSNFPVRGIDVSRHQGAIEWRSVPRDEVHFVYIKASEGGDFRDARFAENWKASAEAGFRRGAYHFFTMTTPGAQQAANFTAVVPNDPSALPPAIDLEFWGNSSARPSAGDFQRELNIFIAEIRAFYGREPVLYTATDFQDRYLRDFPMPRLWIRSVVTSPGFHTELKWTFWQYSEKGRVRGIQGFVDQNVFNGGLDAFESWLNNRN